RAYTVVAQRLQQFVLSIEAHGSSFLEATAHTPVALLYPHAQNSPVNGSTLNLPRGFGGGIPSCWETFSAGLAMLEYIFNKTGPRWVGRIRSPVAGSPTDYEKPFEGRLVRRYVPRTATFPGTEPILRGFHPIRDAGVVVRALRPGGLRAGRGSVAQR